MHLFDTERLHVREFTPADASFLLGLLNEPGWIRHINDPGVRTLEQTRVWMEERLFKAYRETGHGFWAMQRRDDGSPGGGGELVGLCGLFRRDSLPAPDLGYALPARHEGQGYALEAARGCVDHARRVLGWPTLMAITAEHNERSVRLLGHLGFVEGPMQQLDGYDTPSRVFRLLLTPPAPAPAA